MLLISSNPFLSTSNGKLPNTNNLNLLNKAKSQLMYKTLDFNHNSRRISKIIKEIYY